MHGALLSSSGFAKVCLTEGVSQSECWVGILSLVVADVPGNTVISSLPKLGDDKHWALPAFSCDPSRQGGGTWTRAWVKGGQRLCKQALQGSPELVLL